MKPSSLADADVSFHTRQQASLERRTHRRIPSSLNANESAFRKIFGVEDLECVFSAYRVVSHRLLISLSPRYQYLLGTKGCNHFHRGSPCDDALYGSDVFLPPSTRVLPQSAYPLALHPNSSSPLATKARSTSHTHPATRRQLALSSGLGPIWRQQYERILSHPGRRSGKCEARSSSRSLKGSFLRACAFLLSSSSSCPYSSPPPLPSETRPRLPSERAHDPAPHTPTPYPRLLQQPNLFVAPAKLPARPTSNHFLPPFSPRNPFLAQAKGSRLGAEHRSTELYAPRHAR